MARVFTTLFSHNGASYTAVISNLGNAVNIYIPDESLHHILPDGKGSYHPAEGLKIDTPRLSPAQRLMLNVLASIEEKKEPVLEGQKEAKA